MGPHPKWSQLKPKINLQQEKNMSSVIPFFAHPKKEVPWAIAIHKIHHNTIWNAKIWNNLHCSAAGHLETDSDFRFGQEKINNLDLVSWMNVSKRKNNRCVKCRDFCRLKTILGKPCVFLRVFLPMFPFILACSFLCFSYVSFLVNRGFHDYVGFLELKCNVLRRISGTQIGGFQTQFVWSNCWWFRNPIF